jgi:type II secretory pathway pseudopilin PulG
MNHRIWASPIRRRLAFTLVEAVVAMAITAIAGSALLLGVSSSLTSTNEAEQQAVALGIAQQLLDEAAGAMLRGTSQITPPTANSKRDLFDEVDDYQGVRSQPPVDPWGVRLGEDDGQGGRRLANFCAPNNYLDRWREEVDVYYVDESSFTRLPAGQVSDCRAIEVRVLYLEPDGRARELAKLQQVVTYVPPRP